VDPVPNPHRVLELELDTNTGADEGLPKSGPLLPPALGLGLELNPAAIDEYADGKSGPDFGNPSSAPVFVSNSNSSTLWGFGTGSTITLLSADATLRPRLTGMGGGFELYMPLEDEMMFQFSPQDLGASHDVDRSCDYRFTPVRGRRSLCPCGRQPLVWKPGLHFPLCLGPGRRDRLVSSLPTCHRPRPAFQQRMNIDDTMLPMQTAHISFREGPGAGFTPRMPATGSLCSSISALRTSLLGERNSVRCRTAPQADDIHLTPPSIM
jgi:hypothetical protein